MTEKDLHELLCDLNEIAESLSGHQAAVLQKAMDELANYHVLNTKRLDSKPN